MSIVTTKSAKDFIASANLPKAPVRRRDAAVAETPMELKDTDAQALVVGSSLVVAAKGVPAQARSDLINCTKLSMRNRFRQHFHR
jgi:hypothetical protein